MRVVSGVQPSGDLHLGNYFGAIEQFLDLQDRHECFFFVADYHALTTVHDAERLRRLSIETVSDYLALGLDPDRSVIFVQSDVPELTELAWILSTVTPLQLLTDCHAYQQKIEQGLPAHHGLFAYPVLMAADILIYGSDLVPVGEDQRQHVDVACKIATAFNETYGDTFPLPRPHILESAAVITGLDGRKMSKSYKNTVGVFDSEEEIRNKVMHIKTDSQAIVKPRDPLAASVFALFKLFAARDEYEDLHRQFAIAKIGNQEIKKRLIELINERFASARAKREDLLANPDSLAAVLKKGSDKARAGARETLDRVRKAVGYT